MLCTQQQKQSVLHFVIPCVSNSTLSKILTTSKDNKNHVLQTISHLRIKGKIFTDSYNCTSISSFCSLQSIHFEDHGFAPICLSVISPLQRQKIRSLKFYFININNFNLLEQFTCLESLDLSMCSLPDSNVLSALNGCSKLKKLKLKNAFNGLDVGISFLQYMPRLEKVSLRMYLDDYSPLKHLTNLKKLNLEDITRQFDDKEHDFSSLQLLTQLSSLRLAGDQGVFIDLSQFSHLVNLQVLEFHHVHNITTLSSFKHFKNVKRLVFWNCSAIVDVSFLSFFPTLQELSIDYCMRVEDFSSVRSLLSLTSLALNFSHRSKNLVKTLDFLRPLKNLNYLRLFEFSEIVDLEPLGALSQLKKLDLDECSKVTSLSPLSSLPKLEELIIRKLPLADLGFALSFCPSLKVIILNRCRELQNLDSLINHTTPATVSTIPPVSHVVSSLDINFSQPQSPLKFSCALEKISIDSCNGLKSIDLLSKIASLKRFEVVRCQHVNFKMANDTLMDLNKTRLSHGSPSPATMEFVPNVFGAQVVHQPAFDSSSSSTQSVEQPQPQCTTQ